MGKNRKWSPAYKGQAPIADPDVVERTLDAAFKARKTYHHRLMILLAYYSGGRRREIISMRMGDVQPVVLRSESGREFGMCHIVLHGIKDGCGGQTKGHRRWGDGIENTPPNPEYYDTRKMEIIPAPLRVWTEYQLYIKEDLKMDIDSTQGDRQRLLFPGQRRPEYTYDFSQHMAPANFNTMLYKLCQIGGLEKWKIKSMRTLYNTEIAHTIGDDLDTIIFSRHKDTRSLAPYKYRNRRDAIEQKLVGAMFEEDQQGFEQKIMGQLEELTAQTDQLLQYIAHVQPLVQSALVHNHPRPSDSDTKLTAWT